MAAVSGLPSSVTTLSFTMTEYQQRAQAGPVQAGGH